MKKFLLVTFISLVTLSTTFAAYIFPGWDCKDVAKINQAIIDAQTENKKEIVILRLVVMKNIVEKNLTTFNAIKNEIDTLVNTSTTLNNNDKERIKKVLTVSIIMRSKNSDLIQQGAEYLKANISYKEPFFLNYVSANIYTKNLSLTNDEIYNYIITYFKRNQNLKNVKSTTALKAVKKFVEICPNVSYTTQKEDLTYLNRIFTRKLIENKTLWEPVVVQIRTALETY